MTKTKQTIIINGRRFDAATGLPLEAPPQNLKKPAKKTIIIKDIAPAIAEVRQSKTSRQPAPHVKPRVQKSTTLRRSVLKKPASKRPVLAQRVPKKIERSHHISRFAPVTTPIDASQKPQQEPDHQLAAQAQHMQASHAAHLKKQAEAKNKPAISSRMIKDHLLKQQLEKAPLGNAHTLSQAGTLSARARFMSVATTSLALILLGGYLTYINIPNLSIRVAAANAGIDASLPRYQPEGYRIHGPITYTEGQVSVSYQDSDSNKAYQIIQKSSDWDPQATLDNYVIPASGGDYQIHSSQGLTVYTYDTHAAWVNGGILHVIDATAPLSGSQVERIAVSM